jgi:hypothetical protein
MDRVTLCGFDVAMGAPAQKLEEILVLAANQNQEKAASFLYTTAYLA